MDDFRIRVSKWSFLYGRAYEFYLFMTKIDIYKDPLSGISLAAAIDAHLSINKNSRNAEIELDVHNRRLYVIQ